MSTESRGESVREPRIEYYHEAAAPIADSIVVNASACVVDEVGAVLFIRRSDTGELTLPGGAQEIGETLAHTVVREVKEETGVNVEVARLVGVYSDPDYVISYPDGRVGQEFSVCFLAHPIGGAVRVSSESSDVYWIDYADLDTVAVKQPIRMRIQHAFDDGRRAYFT